MTTVPQHLHFAVVFTPLGEVTIATDGRALTGCWFEGQSYFPSFDAELIVDAVSHPILAAAKDGLGAYFEGKDIAWNFPIEPVQGTALQRAVWQELRTIPRGQTRTYGELAEAIGKPNAARAVGQAVGKNPISIIVPCHRVVGSTGALTGYAGGKQRKVELLRIEGAL